MNDLDDQRDTNEPWTKIQMKSGKKQGKFWGMTQWSIPFVVMRVTPYKIVDVRSEPTCSFILNGQRLKHYTNGDAVDQGMSLVLKEPPRVFALTNRQAKTMLNKVLSGRKPITPYFPT